MIPFGYSNTDFAEEFFWQGKERKIDGFQVCHCLLAVVTIH